ncbi:hypothetical protein S7S_01945 [Isoalcanivorax pacificus W11-5]|uniref:Uncharacterized protein n=1 Tax=Isoalcanivorax pacificus W11-5 TaxID=391936 RepID=A0A0B4XIA7_9GAMM|nr:hypothetical protein [Isoalcanivorax pacificus]AJD46811.1 hypothetical protein S7S_01945 [Isoalcanivorax pacificus W11-5]
MQRPVSSPHSTTRPGHWLAALVLLLCATLTNQWPAQWGAALPDADGPRSEQHHQSAGTALLRATLSFWQASDEHGGDGGAEPAPLAFITALLPTPRPVIRLRPQPVAAAHNAQALGKGPRHPHAPPVLS